MATDRLADRGNLRRDPRHAAPAGGRALEGGAGHRRHQRGEDRERLAHRVGARGQGAGDRGGHVATGPDSGEGRSGEHLGGRGLRRRLPGHRRLGRDRAVEEDGGDLHRCHAIDQRVVGLADDRELLGPQSGDQLQPPERAFAVQRPGEQAAGDLFEPPVTAARHEVNRVDVRLDREVRVVDPVGVAEAEGGLGEPAPQSRNRVQARSDRFTQGLDRRRLAAKAHRPADGHRRLLGLQVEEDAVQRAQPVEGCHLALQPTANDRPRWPVASPRWKP